VSAAYKMPKDGDAAIERDAAIQAALLKAAEVPLETARACSDVARLAATCAAKGNVNTLSDAGVAALLAEAACRGAAYNVWINVASLIDSEVGAALTAEVDALVEATRASARIATTRVEEAIR
jgi:glutamate formiminotransferase/formiminotetrahydrofolate cyclodeaminase